MSTVLAWHFTGDTLRDGSPIPPDGTWLEYHGPVVMCSSGLHASRHPMDALQYAPGNILHQVECDGIVEEQPDKLVCRKRRIIQSFNVEALLRRFAKDQALSVSHLWEMPAAIREYLESDTDDAAARDAAWDAARAAARDAAWAAARDAAWAAARDAAWDAARDDFAKRIAALFNN